MTLAVAAGLGANKHQLKTICAELMKLNDKFHGRDDILYFTTRCAVESERQTYMQWITQRYQHSAVMPIQVKHWTSCTICFISNHTAFHQTLMLIAPQDDCTHMYSSNGSSQHVCFNLSAVFRLSHRYSLTHKAKLLSHCYHSSSKREATWQNRIRNCSHVVSFLQVTSMQKTGKPHPVYWDKVHQKMTREELEEDWHHWQRESKHRKKGIARMFFCCWE